MSRIDDIFATLRREGRTALMPFLTAGHPSLDVTRDAITRLHDAGASVVEIGIPFSDPIADGPVIASAMHDALQRGVTPGAIFDMVRDVRSSTPLGLVAMVSESIVRRMGEDEFVKRAAAAGFDGLIVPDLDLHAARPVHDACARHDLAFALLIAPTTSAARAAEIVALCRGFVYVLARTGITGERDERPDIEPRIAMLRELTDLPLAVGFGISSAEHVGAVTAAADAAIVGSALVRRMSDANDPAAEAATFVADLARGLHSRAARA